MHDSAARIGLVSACCLMAVQVCAGAGTGFGVPLRDNTVVFTEMGRRDDTLALLSRSAVVRITDSRHDAMGLDWVSVLCTPADSSATGWVEKMLIEPFPDSLSAVGAMEERLRADTLRFLRRELVGRHPEWPRKAVRAIKQGNILLGMTFDQMVAAWGEPLRKDRLFILRFGECEACFYRNRTVVILKSGEIVGWTEEER